MKKADHNNRRIYRVLIVAVLLIIGMTAGSYFISQAVLHANRSTAGEQEDYRYHVAVITGNPRDVFWDTFFSAARESGEKNGILIEKFGSGLNEDYSETELLRMAIAASVDGIIIEADASPEMKELIDEAGKEKEGHPNGIAVFTVGTDAIDSARKSFISANDYALGELYGKEILGTPDADGKKVTVLLQTDSEHSQPNLVYSGINEVLQGSSMNLSLSALLTGQQEEFESEERIRGLLLSPDDRPDIVVALNVVDTISTYQCLIDYNLVGKVEVIGSYYSSEILEGIKKGIIRSSIATNADDMGKKAAEGMYEYLTESYVSEYISVDSDLITPQNADTYLDDENTEVS